MTLLARLKSWWSGTQNTLVEPSIAPERSATSFVLRNGRSIESGSVFAAWTSGDLPTMISARSATAHPIDRHFLLMKIVDKTYRLRENPEMRALCVATARQHLDEMPNLAAPLARNMGGVLPRITSFQQLATVLTENGDFENAVAVCRHALALGLHDNTHGGFEERIRRIQKKAQRSVASAGADAPTA